MSYLSEIVSTSRFGICKIWIISLGSEWENLRFIRRNGRKSTFEWPKVVSEVIFPRFWGVVCIEKCFRIFVSVIGSSVSEMSQFFFFFFWNIFPGLGEYNINMWNEQDYDSPQQGETPSTWKYTWNLIAINRIGYPKYFSQIYKFNQISQSAGDSTGLTRRSLAAVVSSECLGGCSNRILSAN